MNDQPGGTGVTEPKPPPSPARVWWMAPRPATLPASVSPVLAGTAIAVHDHAVRTLPGLGALVVAIAMQVGVNYANDYSDYVRGADRRRVGPLRASSSGVVPPGHVKRAAIAAFSVAAVVGGAISLVTDRRLLVVGALAGDPRGGFNRRAPSQRLGRGGGLVPVRLLWALANR